jgi:hypothetical protein
MSTQEEKEKRREYYLNRKRRGQIYLIPSSETSAKIKELAENRKWSQSKTVAIILEDFIDMAYNKYMIKE